MGSDARGERPLFAIVGSGPSGFFAASHLLDAGACVDMFERLPAPYGLVRYGVAPDHQKIKSIEAAFAQTASHANFRLLANCEVGASPLSVAELLGAYDGVILACGASAESLLGIDGESLDGTISARAFASWYNSHPDWSGAQFKLRGSHAVIIGHGNVALDVARMLLADPTELTKTDISPAALTAIQASGIRKVTLIGRRSPLEAKFTPSELKAISKLPGVQVRLDPHDFSASRNSLKRSMGADAAACQVLYERILAEPGQIDAKVLEIMFHWAPIAIVGRGHVQGLRLERTAQWPADAHKPGFRTTGEFREIPCEVVFRSTGARGRPLPGVPFDATRGIVPNAGGRVLDNERPLPGLYVTGWLKRGASGTIGTNRVDSLETVTAAMHDLANVGPSVKEGLAAVCLARPTTMTMQDWRIVNQKELITGAVHRRVRLKYATVGEILCGAGKTGGLPSGS